MAELWRRACESGYCVEVRSVDEVGEVWELRDGKLGDASPVLEVTVAELDSFCAFWVSHRLSYREDPAPSASVEAGQ